MARRMQHWFIMSAISVAMLCLLLGASSAPAIASLQQSSSVATLVAIRVASHPEASPKYDRVVFELKGNLPNSIRVEYVSKLIADGSGRALPVKGNNILHVVLSPAYAHTDAGKSTVPARQSYNLPIVKELVRSGDFEAVVSYGIGVSNKAEMRFFTLTNPTRVVVDFLRT